MLLLSYTGCFTFMKWFELLREQYGCEAVMLHTPYTGDGEITQNMRDYMVKQLKEDVIPTLEEVSGVKFDIDRLREYLRESARAEDDFVAVLKSGKNKPSPIDAYFGGIYYIGPIFGAFRGTKEATEYYRLLRRPKSTSALANGQGADHAGRRAERGEVPPRRQRGRPTTRPFRDFWKMFYEEGAVCVASSYTKVGGVYDFGFRHDPDNPLVSLADYCLNVYTNRSLPQRVDMLANLHRGV